MDDAGAQPISELGYHQRRYIAVVGEHGPEAAAGEGGTSWWPAVGLIGSALIPGGLWVRGGLALASVIAAAWSGDGDAPAKPTTEGVPAKTPPKDGIVLATLAEANCFLFSSGSAEIGQVYAANPVSDRRYYPIESYNDDLLDHKLSELERILHSLGAKHYKITFLDESDSHSDGKVGVKGAVQAKGKVEVDRARRRRSERGGTSDGRDPQLPDQLRWYDREPSWQALAESRLHYGRREFSLLIELEQRFKGSAEAVANLRALKFNVGGEHGRNTNVTLSVTGSF